MGPERTESRLTRRSIIQKGAVGAAAVWAAPVLTSVPAAAQQGSVQLTPGGFLFAFGIFGTADGEFELPYGVAVDATGRIHVADEGNDRIQVFDADGTHQLTFGSVGSADGQFGNPSGVAVDATGRIHVADSLNNRIQVFQGL